MNIIVTGGTGFIGKELVRHLLEANHSIVVLTRRIPERMNRINNLRYLHWDGKSDGVWTDEIEGADVIINLAGESIGTKRWSKKQKEKILSSRIDSTKAIVQAISRATRKPEVLINASAVGYYGNINEEVDVTESFPGGEGFLAMVVDSWEREALKVLEFGTRVVTLRTGVVLSETGGALKKMILPFKFFVGGPIGSGKQWFPWIHVDDLIGVILYTIKNFDVVGPLNVTAPQSITMKQFCSVLGEVMNRPSWIPVPAFVLKMLFGEMSEMILTGQRVVPSRLIENGFQFKYSNLDEALQSIFQKNNYVRIK